MAIDTGSDEAHAVGVEAERIIGRTPATISAVRPLRRGVIADVDVTEQMLRYFIARVLDRRWAHTTSLLRRP